MNKQAVSGRERPIPGKVSWRSHWRLFAGTFLAFATIGVLLDICLVVRRPWYGVAFTCVFAGLISAGWAYAWQVRRGLLIFLIPLTAFYQPIFDYLVPAGSLARAIGLGGFDPARVIEAAVCLAFLVAAYVLFVTFVRVEEARNQRLRTEIALAQRIHETLVPAIAFSNSLFEVHGISLPSSEMGGDLLDLCQDGDTATMIVADVSGHGVAAGVVMAMVKSAVRTVVRRNQDLASLVTDLNRVMYEVTEAGRFVTFASLRVGPQRRVNYALAGHLSILWHRASKNGLDELPNEHLPLGVVETSDFSAQAVTGGTGDLFALYTDGLVETMNPAGELFGEERLRSLIHSRARDPLAEIHAAVFSAVDAHGPRADDQTLLLVRLV